MTDFKDCNINISFLARSVTEKLEGKVEKSPLQVKKQN